MNTQNDSLYSELNMNPLKINVKTCITYILISLIINDKMLRIKCLCLIPDHIKYSRINLLNNQSY